VFRLPLPFLFLFSPLAMPLTPFLSSVHVFCRNMCAYVVQKNITCTMQDGMATYVKADYTTKCIWGQKCPVLMYRTFFKPQYKVGYKTITELEWRCCPGESCFDKHLEPGRPFPVGQPDISSIPTGQLPSGGEIPSSSFSLRPKTGLTGERLSRMEEDLRRLSQGFDTLNGMVVSLEERLRVSLREDTSKMIASVLTGAPRHQDASVGFGIIPDGTPEGLETVEGFPGFGELAGRVTEVKDELKIKSNMLDEIHTMVLGHDGQLKRLMDSATGRPVVNQRVLEDMLDARLAGVRAEILDGFEKRLSGLEDYSIVIWSAKEWYLCLPFYQVQQQCHKEHLTGQEQIELSLDGRETGLRKELGDLQAQILGLTVTESCCGQVNSLSQRVLLLEESVKGLTESQRQLQASLSDQTIHVETLLETHLSVMERRLNTSIERAELDGSPLAGHPSLDGFKTQLEDKLKALEERLFVAVEELSNATAPALLEGHVVPQLTDLELLCTSSCQPTTSVGDTDLQAQVDECKDTEKKINIRLDVHKDQLNRLNGTLHDLLARISEEDESRSVQGEITLLKINVNSVNRTLKGLRDSVNFFAREVGQANSTWQQREERLASQVHGITELVGRQASMLGAGERRLIQLKGELQGLRNRLAGEMQGCRSTALGVRKEVMAVDSRIAQVEGQCSSLSELADHLERIRGELESHSDSFLAQVNGTLTSHSHQLAELKSGLQDCMDKADHTGQRGDQ
uniref:EMI domain-containing protein n=1 Tax=Denticeps clupeoides TaxID=299321 RepID=A0AAY4CTW0_9TELE